MKTIKAIIIILLLSCIVSCDRLNNDYSLIDDRSSKIPVLSVSNSNLAETTAPTIIRNLSQDFQPDSLQINIIAPKSGQTIKQTDIEIELAAENFEVFKSDRLALGNHVNLILDNEPARAIYNLDEPIIIKNITPGTHTLRAFAVCPWGESFKTRSAYAQTTFNVLTETQDNRLNPNYPLLTYNSPTGSYGAEPILLDFYLSDPSYRDNQSNNLQQYSVKATVNGTSFAIDDWQPYYLTGFEIGDNWIQLELIDESGKTIDNAFNDTVRVFNYNPQQEDALAKLVTNQLSSDDARSIVDRKYIIQPLETSEIPDLLTVAEPERIDVEEVKKEPESLAVETPNSVQDTQEIPQVDSFVEQVANEPVSDLDGKSAAPIKADPIEKIESNKTEPAELKSSLPVNILDKSFETAGIEEEIAEPEPESEPKPQLAAEQATKITIKEPNTSPAPIAEITIPQPQSVEIRESEIAIAIPETKSQPVSDSLERSPKSLWWKKILVGIRHTIENLVKKLPSEV